VEVMTDVKTTITTIDLLRHGECEGEPCYKGTIDIPLSKLGWEQMENQFRQHQTDWQRIISSPLSRCADFATFVSEKQSLSLVLNKEFQEMHFGEWEGQAIDKIWETQQEAVKAWAQDPVRFPPPLGEPADVFSRRVERAFLEIIKQYDGEKILIICHGGVIRVLLAHCLGLSLTALNCFDVPYACFSRIQVIRDVIVNTVDSTSSLDGESIKTYYRLLAHNK
jgi:alpha-ribazole phosphatase